ncbi:MAG: peptide ABC transporter permease [Rhodobacteraceae bacterium]|nr:peptide ABC transporter permease [Paracoccaceae bacterium]
MSGFAFAAVIGAALLHAVWNALVRVPGARLGAMLVLSLVQGAIGAAVALALPWPPAAAWGWIAASGIVHSAYKMFLLLAYGRGDLSRVYPIARGAAPLMVLAVSVALLAEPLPAVAVAGVVLLGAGILAMAAGALRAGEARAMIPFALATAAMTAAYSLIDGTGARVAGDAALFVAWLFAADAAIFAGVTAVLCGTGPFRAGGRVWARGAVAGLASWGAYAIAVWAMTVAPIALVSALRETSILFAVLIGRFAFGERLGGGKLAAAGMILAGVALMRL